VFLIGFFFPLTIVNGFSLGGIYVPLVYLLAVFALQWRIAAGSRLALNLPVTLFGLSFSGLSLFYFDGMDFLNGLKVLLGLMLSVYLHSLAECETKLYSGFRAAMSCCLIVCVAQFALFVIGGEGLFYRFSLPVDIWNSAGWYFMKDRDYFPAFPGLSYEPAYMAIFFSFAFVLAYFKRDRGFLIVCVAGLILTFSRNGILFLACFMLFWFLVNFFRSKFLLFAAFCFALFAIPLLLFVYVDVVGIDGLDVSIYSRVVPFFIFFEDLSFLEMLVGAAYQNVSIESPRYDEFFLLFPGSSESPFVDPRSFLGGMLFSSGLVGLSLFLGLVYYLSRGANKNLYLFLVPFVLSSLNAYIVDWPVFWVLLFYLSRFDRIFYFGSKLPVPTRIGNVLNGN